MTVPDTEVLRNAMALGRAARKHGETAEAVRGLWGAWCTARGVDEAAAKVGLAVALKEFTGCGAAN